MATQESYGTMPSELYEEYTSGKLSPEGKRLVEADVAAGLWTLPEGVTPAMFAGSAQTTGGQQAPSFEQSVPAEGPTTTSAQLSFQPSGGTAPTPTPGAPPPPPPKAEEIPDNPEDVLPSWTSQPEIRNVRTILGAVTADTPRLVEILKSIIPDLKVRAGNEGATILTRKDGTEFAIRPGMTLENVGLLLASTVGTGIATAALGSALTTMAPTLPILGPVAARLGPVFGKLVAKIPGGLRSVLGGAAGGVADQVVANAAQRTAGAETPLTENTGWGAGLGGAVGAFPGVKQFAGGQVRKGLDYLEAARPTVLESSGEIGGAAINASQPGFLGIFEKDAQAARDLARAMNPDEAVIQAGKRVGIEPPLAAVTRNPEAAQVFNTLASDASGSPLARQTSNAVSQLDEATLRELKSAGIDVTQSSDLADIAKGIKGYGEFEIDRFHEKAKELYDRINAKIPANEPVDTTAVRAFIDEEAAKKVVKGSETAGHEYLQSPLMDKVLAAIGDGSEPATYNRLDTLRKVVDDAAHNTGTFKDDPNQWIAAALTDRLNEVLRPVVKKYKQTKTLEQAKAATRAKYALIDSQKTLFGKKLQGSFVQKAQGATRKLLAEDPTTLGQILAHVPKERKSEVVTAALTDLLQDAPSSKFVELWEAMKRSPATYTAVMAEMKPHAKQSLEDIYTLASAFERARKAGTISKDAMIPDSSTFDNFIDYATRAARIGTLSLPWRWAGAARMFLTSIKHPNDPKIRATRKWLADPATRDVLLGLAKGQPSQTAVRRMVNTPSFKLFRRFANVGPNALRWANRGLQAALRGASAPPEEEE